MRWAAAISIWILVAVGCGAGSPGGPAMTGRVEEERASGPDPASNDIMMREARTNRAVVKHIVVDADKKELALELLRRVRAGEAIEPLMAQHSTDPGSAASGESYEVRPDSNYVFEFKRLALRLEVGEVGLVSSHFGWHVMKRID